MFQNKKFQPNSNQTKKRVLTKKFRAMRKLNLIMKFVVLALLMFNFHPTNAQNKREISLQDAKEIAKRHNEILSQTIRDNMTKEEFEEEIIKHAPDELNPDLQNQILEYLNSKDEKSLEMEILKHLKTKQSIAIYKSAKKIILTSPDNYSALLDNKIKEASKLKGKEREILYIFIEVSKESLNFWNNYKKKVNLPANNNQAKKSIDWGAIAYADGAGAVGTLLRTWALAGFGPLSWGAIIGAIGWGAAWASGTSLLYQLM